MSLTTMLLTTRFLLSLVTVHYIAIDGIWTVEWLSVSRRETVEYVERKEQEDKNASYFEDYASCLT